MQQSLLLAFCILLAFMVCEAPNNKKKGIKPSSLVQTEDDVTKTITGRKYKLLIPKKN
jgi:hypothetical protein